MSMKSNLELATKATEKIITEANQKINLLGEKGQYLAENLNRMQDIFDQISGVPNETKIVVENLKEKRLNWVQQVKKIENDYRNSQMKIARSGAIGTGAGVAVISLGPTVAMGVATSFGVASTGTAISSLTGVAATNAALAWLGGGALSIGGAGMAGGSAFLALAGPVGWTISGIALLSSGFFFLKNNGERKKLEQLSKVILRRDQKKYNLVILELEGRIETILGETLMIDEANSLIKQYGTDYDLMTESQQYTLISYVNLMRSSTKLLVNPIINLQPNFTKDDLDDYINNTNTAGLALIKSNTMQLQIFLGNLLYKVIIDESTQKALWKALRQNKDFLQEFGIAKEDFEYSVMLRVRSALKFQSSKDN